MQAAFSFVVFLSQKTAQLDHHQPKENEHNIYIIWWLNNVQIYYHLIFEPWKPIIGQTAFEEAVGLLHTETVCTALIMHQNTLAHTNCCILAYMYLCMCFPLAYYNVDGMKGLWCTSTVRLLSTQK